jgi:Ca2+-binding RTX toxin-like protein
MVMFTRNPIAAASHRAAAVVAESLESRRLMSASIVSGALVVNGTDEPDTILVSMNPKSAKKLDVDINGVTQSFALNRVKNGVRVFGLGGDDTLIINDGSGTVAPPVTMHGGAGNDLLFGGASNDALFGNEGDDMFFGNDGHDQIDGGDGNDTAFGGSGNDVMHGGAGDDFLSGEVGNDSLYGDDGVDVLDGGDDDDYLDGGAEHDSLFGGFGSDTFASTDEDSEILDLMPEDIRLT